MEHTVLVTGGAGFIGANLCRDLLSKGCRVICVDSFVSGRPENIRALESAVTEPAAQKESAAAESAALKESAVEQSDPAFVLIERDVREPLTDLPAVDEIYHLACPASPPFYQADPVGTLMTCILGTKNVLDLARKSGARVLIASTSEVYGDPKEHPQRETYYGNVCTTGPRACYDEGKRAGETLAFDYRRMYGTNVCVVRIFNTYGPFMRPDDGRVISNLICQALTGEDLTIYGDGSQTRSFCFVDDLIRALEAAMASGISGPVNLGNPGEYTIEELADLILSMTGSKSRKVHRPLPENDPVLRRPDISKAQEWLGWKPQIPLEEGLRRTIRYFRDIKNTADHAAGLQPESNLQKRNPDK